MDASCHAARQAYWRNVISECNSRNSTLSKRQWCELNGIELKTFYYWQNRFRKDALSLLASEVPGSVASIQEKHSFVDITPAISSDAAVQSLEFVPELMMELYGFRVYVGSSIQEQTLLTVMKALEHA